MTYNRDLDNIHKVLIDSLVYNEILADDNQISRIESRKIISKGLNKKIEIIIREDDLKGIPHQII